MVIRVLVHDEKLLRWLTSEPARSADAEGHIILYSVTVPGLTVKWPIFRDAWKRIR
jgi:hypothetical protein